MGRNLFKAINAGVFLRLSGRRKRNGFCPGHSSPRRNSTSLNKFYPADFARHLKMAGLAAVIILILNTMPTFAETQEAKTITIREAIQMALRQNYALREFATTVSTSKIAVGQALSAFFPDISISATGSKYFVPEAQRQNAGGETVNAQLSANLELFSGFGNIAFLKQARRSFLAQEASYEYNRQQLIFQTISQYLQVIETRDFMKVAEQNLLAQQQQLQLIEEFKKQGNKAITDVLQQQATVQQAQLQLLTARQNYQVNRVSLLETLGRYPTADYEFAAVDVKLINSSLNKRQPFAENDTMLEGRQDIQAQIFHLDAAKEGIRVAEAGFWPSLSLFANLSSDYNSLNTQYGFGKQFSQNRVGTIGLSLSIPIFDRLVTVYNLENAKEQVADQRLILESLKLSASSQYRQALLAYRTAVEQQASAQAQLQYSDEALKAVEARYKVGAATYVDLSLAQSQYLTASYDLVSAEYNKLLQYLTVLYQQGAIDEGISILDTRSGESE